MSDPISPFFDAWQIDDDGARHAKITSVVTETVQYHDPKTPETLVGIEALNNYVGMFSANAPGWSAKVIKLDSMAGVSRATIAFSGAGPDGTEQTQLGQYFVEQEGELISSMIGFVGTGGEN